MHIYFAAKSPNSDTNLQSYWSVYASLSVSACVFDSCVWVCFRLCSGVNIIWFVLWLCSLQFRFSSVSYSVCVSCQLIILSGSEAWTDTNKREMNDRHLLWSNYGNMFDSITTAAGWKWPASVPLSKAVSRDKTFVQYCLSLYKSNNFKHTETLRRRKKLVLH